MRQEGLAAKAQDLAALLARTIRVYPDGDFFVVDSGLNSMAVGFTLVIRMAGLGHRPVGLLACVMPFVPSMTNMANMTFALPRLTP